MENKLFIGCHIGTTCGFVSTADYAYRLGANFFQIFLSSPRNYKRTNRSNSELMLLKKKLELYSMKLVIHANYMLNFCNDKSNYKHKRAITLLVADLKECSTLGAMGVVIHMGKKLKMDQEVAISNYVDGLKTVLSKTPKDSTIILETGAGVGTEVCTKIPDLYEMYCRFSEEEKERIMFCIDTCHVFAAGYDLGDEDYVDIFNGIIETTITWSKVACVHLNNSKCPLGSCKDRHADLTAGLIESKGLKKFVQLCYKKGVPMVLETPCDSDPTCNSTVLTIKQICTARKWTNECN